MLALLAPLFLLALSSARTSWRSAFEPAVWFLITVSIVGNKSETIPTFGAGARRRGMLS